MAIAGSLVATASAQTTDFERGMRRMRSELTQTQTLASTAGQGFALLGRSVTALAVGTIGFAAIKSGVEGVVRAGLDLERLRNSFTAITGSATQSRQEFGFVRDTANRLGLEIQTLGASYRGLLAATRGTQAEGQGVRDLFTALTNASRLYGLSTEATGRALLAFQQIISKGKVTQEDLRGQLAEALPGASQIAARGFATTTSRLDDMITRGLDALTFMQRFTEQLSREAPPATAVAGRGIAALGNEILLLKDRIAQSGVLAFIDRATEFGARILGRSRTQAEQGAQAQRTELQQFGINPEINRTDLVSGLASINRQIKEQERLQAFFAQQAGDEQTAASPAIVRNREALAALRAEQQALISSLKDATVVGERINAIETRRNQQRTQELRTEAEEKAAEAQREKERFAEIAADTSRRIDLEEEQARAQEAGATRRVAQLGEITKAQNSFVEGLEEELAQLTLANQELAKRQRLALGLTDAEPITARVIALQDELEIRKALASIPGGPLGQDDIGSAAAQERRSVAKEAADARKRDLREARDEIRVFGDFFTSTILDATEIGKRGFSGFVDSVISDLQRLLIRQFLAPALGSLLTRGLGLAVTALGLGSGVAAGGGGSVPAGDSGGGILGAFAQRANGGPVMGPGLTLVGERGPELLALRAGQSGYVYPNGTMPGGVTVTVYQNFGPGSDVTTLRRSRGEFQQGIANAVRAAIQNGN